MARRSSAAGHGRRRQPWDDRQLVCLPGHELAARHHAAVPTTRHGHDAKGGGVSARPLPVPVNPALLKHADQRRQHLENRIADQITRFAGSMLFVYLHIIWFAAWILLGSSATPMGC
jgi:hypothetical protein